MLRGVARLIVAYGDEMNDDIFKEKVGFFSPGDIKRIASGLVEGALGYAEAMLDAYNKKMKPGLPWTKLHAQESVTLVRHRTPIASGDESDASNPDTQQQILDEKQPSQGMPDV